MDALKSCAPISKLPPAVNEVIPSTVPPLISAVSATKLSIFAVPSIYKSFHSKVDEPKSDPLSAFGTIFPLAVTSLSTALLPDTTTFLH